ncbi:MAG: MiaB/RimO family radical SAM methylthiotransferase [bacterium]
MKRIKRIKRYYLRTYGCAANEKDSQDIKYMLDNLGLLETKKFGDADVVILNSCSVRQAAEDKIYGVGKKMKEFKPVVILTGCMVGSATGKRKRYELEYLQKKIPWVNYFLNPSQIKEIPNILSKEDFIPDVSKLFVSSVPSISQSCINISTGCDNFCSYCVVPYARGLEISRTKEDILSEVKNLVKKGISEITFLGQNVNSWGLNKETKFNLRAGSFHKLPFAFLLRETHEIEGIKKISFLSSNPFDFTQDLIQTLKLPKISRYIHIALQSGDDKILKRMNRRHTVKEFIKLIKEIKKTVPEIEIGTDLIVGFPGETEKQFRNTVTVCQKLKFNVAYISMYSERLGTIAQKLYKDDVPLKEKKRRHKVLTEIIQKAKIQR